MTARPTPHLRRTLGAIGVSAIAAAALVGCIPPPPEIGAPTEPTTDPGGSSPTAPADPTTSEPADPGAGPAVTPEGIERIDFEGEVAVDEYSVGDFTLTERSAVLLGATSIEGEDLQMRLTGNGVDVTNDDAVEEYAGFDWEVGTFDPGIVAVLEPGDYQIEILEIFNTASSFRVTVFHTTTTVSAGSSIDFEVGVGSPGLFMVDPAVGELAGDSGEDTVLVAVQGADGEALRDDDGGGSGNPLLALEGSGDAPYAAVVTPYSFDGDPFRVTVAAR